MKKDKKAAPKPKAIEAQVEEAVVATEETPKAEPKKKAPAKKPAAKKKAPAKKAAPKKEAAPVVEVAETETVASEDFSSKTVAELKALAKEQGITGYTSLKKAELIEALTK